MICATTSEGSKRTKPPGTQEHPDVCCRHDCLPIWQWLTICKLESHHRNSELSHRKWCFSIVLWIYWRVFRICMNLRHTLATVATTPWTSAGCPGAQAMSPKLPPWIRLVTCQGEQWKLWSRVLAHEPQPHVPCPSSLPSRASSQISHFFVSIMVQVWHKPGISQKTMPFPLTTWAWHHDLNSQTSLSACFACC